MGGSCGLRIYASSALLALSVTFCAPCASGDVPPAFLGSELPLKVLSVIPSATDDSDSTRLYGRTALTVVFSRAVIALGADWSDKGNDGQLPDSQLPFTFKSCSDQPEFAVPGRVRWSTTSTARFDAEIDWPSDLCFDLVLNPSMRSFDGLALSLEQTTEGGKPPRLKWRFTTPPMSMHLAFVRSERTAQLTDGRWGSIVDDEVQNEHELPPDGVVYLSFSTEINHKLAFSALKSANPAMFSSEESGKYDNCGRRCLAVRPRGLQANTGYALSFPKGHVYSDVAGKAGEAQSVALKGLLPFSFPFWFEQPPKEDWRGRSFRFRRYKLFLRHGLQTDASRDAQLAALRSAIALKDASGQVLDFSLSLLNNATLQLECAALRPAHGYSIHVAASETVRDGYGQSLMPSSMTFKTSQVPDVFAQASVSPAYFRQAPQDWKVIVTGHGNSWCSFRLLGVCVPHPFEVNAWPVAVDNMAAALAHRFNNRKSFLGSEQKLTLPAPDTSEVHILKLDTRKLLEKHASGRYSGLFLREMRRNEGASSKGFVSVASFGVAFVSTAANKLLVWATSFEDGRPVSGAQVSIYHMSTTYNAQESDVKVTAEGITDSDGLAVIAPSGSRAWQEPHRYGARLVAIVQSSEGEVAMCEQMPVPWQAPDEMMWQGSLVTDRSVYKPGDTVYVKGYVRKRDSAASELSIPSAKDGSFAIEVKWKSDHYTSVSDAAKHRIPVDFVSRYGTLSAKLEVPTGEGDVSFGDIPVRLVHMPPGGEGKNGNAVAHQSVVVADPRPPTVALELSTDAKVVLPGPAASVEIDVKTTTYSGAEVAGANVELTWTLIRGGVSDSASPRPPEPVREVYDSGGGGRGDEVTGIQALPRLPANASAKHHSLPGRFGHGGGGGGGEASGHVTAVTGDNGRKRVTLSLATLLQDAGKDGSAAAPAEEGDMLTVSARWVGPTREVVTAELPGGQIRVSRSPYVLAIAPSQPVSHHDGTPLPGTPFGLFIDVQDSNGESLHAADVMVTLHEWDGKAPIRKAVDWQEPVAKEASAAALQKEVKRLDLLPVASWGSQVGDICIVKSDGGKTPQCSSALTLPAAKKYVVLARSTAPDGVELVSGFVVGKTAQEWRERPLQVLDRDLKIVTDKSTYEVGDTARLSLTLPFFNATALAVWGNGRDTKVKQHRFSEKLGKLQHEMSIDVGEECKLGCNVLVLVTAPGQRKEDVLPVPVPVSPLLDVTLPRSAARSVHLDVPEKRKPLPDDAVQVSVSRAGANAPTKILQPGANATIRVQLPKSEAGAEICIFVTDKAMLDVGEPAHPHSVVSLDKAFEFSRGERFEHFDTRSRLASTDGYDLTAATVLDRAKLDPWAVEEYWPLLPNRYSQQAVEKTDEAYFANKVDELTKFPPPAAWLFDGPGPLLGDPYMGGGAGGFAEAEMADEAMPMAMPMMAREAPAVAMARSAPAPEPMLKMRSKRAGLTTSIAPPPPTPPPKPGKGGKAAGGSSLGKAVYTRSNFQVTPLFVPSVIVGPDGLAEAHFTLPDNIATFDIRVYVVDGKAEHRFAHNSSSIISRREVSLVPSLPRVVRPGDKFECGVTVTRHSTDGGDGASGGGKPAVGVSAKVSGNTTILGLRQTDLAKFSAVAIGAEEEGAQVDVGSLSGHGPHEVVFPFEAKGGGVGSVRLTFSASLQGSGAGTPIDALEVPLPIKPPQAPVVIGTSVAITATPNGTSRWSEGIELPTAMPGSGSLKLVAGVGHLASVVQHAGEVCSQDVWSGESWAAALLPAAALRLYYAPDAALAAGSASQAGLDKVATTFEDALRNLPAYTDSRKGLFWHSGDMQYSWQRASVSLNAFGVFVARIVAEFSSRAPTGGVVDTAATQKPWASLLLVVPPRLTSTWKGALERELQWQIQDLHNTRRCSGDCYDSWGTLAMVRASLGFKWSPSDWQSELSMDRLFSSQALAALSPLGLANAALSYTLHAADYSLPSEAARRLEEVYTRLSNLMRVQGRTAYVASSKGSAHSAGLTANAMVLLALSRAGASALARHFAANSGASLPAKLAAYVADGGEVAQSVRFGGGSWVSPHDAAIVTVALAAYDLAMGMTAPDLVFKASSDGIGLLDYEAHGKSAPPASKTTPWEALARPPSPVQFRASGVGQVSVVATMTFVPASVPTEGAVYRGIFVEKVVRQMDSATGHSVGPPLQVIELGTSVVVTIQITTPDDLSRVTLEDFVSGGLEPVDASVAGDTRGSSDSRGCGAGGMPLRFLWWCAPSFYSVAVRPDRVLWSSQSFLPAGTHTVSYQATATTRGIFVLPPAHAYVNGQPELMGLSKASTVVVAGASPNSPALPDPCKPASVHKFLARMGVHPEKAEAPRGCPGGCPNGGVCQLSTGKCGCYKGMVFTQGDCSRNSSISMSVLLGEDAEGGMASKGLSSGPGGLPPIQVVAAVSTALVAVAFVGFHVRKQYSLAYNSDLEAAEKVKRVETAEQTEPVEPMETEELAKLVEPADAPYSAAPVQETEMASLVNRMPSMDSSALGAGPYL